MLGYDDGSLPRSVGTFVIYATTTLYANDELQSVRKHSATFTSSCVALQAANTVIEFCHHASISMRKQFIIPQA